MTDLKPCRYAVSDLLPQEQPMLLLDAIVGWNDDCLVSEVNIRADSMFLASDGMPPHIAIEWMAQTCGAMVGLQSLEQGEAVRIGFLLGTRDFVARVSRFALGDKLTVTVRPVFSDGQMAVFDCQVKLASEVCATARLNLFQPESLEAMLNEQGLALRPEQK